jgi:hypothetical protein
MAGKPQEGRLFALSPTERQRRWRANKRLKAKREARLAKAARMGNGRDPANEHPEGFHPTPPRGTYALLTRESFHGVIWECACGDGAISRILEAAGYDVDSTDLVCRGYGRGGHDFLTDHTTIADHIITNPPYGPQRGLSARFVEHALSRIKPGGTVCMLLPINWEAAQSHRHLMAKCCRRYTFSRRLEMHRGGYTGKRGSPQLNVAWYVFSNEHTGPTATVVLPPECGEALPLLANGQSMPAHRRGALLK